MYKFILLLGICSDFVLGSKPTIPSKEPEKVVGCYRVINDPYNDPQADLVKKGIGASLCNYLIYSFIGIGSNGSVLTDQGPDTDIDSDSFQHFNGHWKKNPPIKTLAHMAALNDHYTDNPVAVLTDPNLRGKVVNNIVNFVKTFVFNGIDLDLTTTENIYGRPKTDKKNLVLFLQALKDKFHKEGFILCVSVDPREEVAKALYDIKGISAHVNFIILMAFNFPAAFYQVKENIAAHYSPLYPSLVENAKGIKDNIDYVVNYWIGHNISANKFILGTSLNGISYTLANPHQIAKGAPFTEQGLYSYPEMPTESKNCGWPRKPDWNYYYDNHQQVPYFYKGNQMLAIDNLVSMKAKAEYVKKMKLGGAALQYLDQDDVFGKCEEKFAFLKTLNRVLRHKF